MSLADLNVQTVVRVTRIARHSTLQVPDTYKVTDCISDYGDSLSKIEFICDLESDFGTEISDDQAESLITFADVVRLLQP